jgi:tyrosyl-tRNA synthetase
LGDDAKSVFDIIKTCMPEKSNSEIRRLIDQGAVSIDGIKVMDVTKKIQKPNQIKIGKLGFFKVQ